MPTAKKAPKEKFWWFRGESVQQLIAHLIGVGPECRLEVHINGDAMTLHVIPESVGPSEAGGTTNKSFICPPFCP
jgi:hypothetical protein